jgi:hypothetical protein
MSIPEIEAIVDDSLPNPARFPSWWRNDERRMHARAWLAAGWEVAEMSAPEARVVFVRRPIGA